MQLRSSKTGARATYGQVECRELTNTVYTMLMYKRVPLSVPGSYPPKLRKIKTKKYCDVDITRIYKNRVRIRKQTKPIFARVYSYYSLRLITSEAIRILRQISTSQSGKGWRNRKYHATFKPPSHSETLESKKSSLEPQQHHNHPQKQTNQRLLKPSKQTKDK